MTRLLLRYAVAFSVISLFFERIVTAQSEVIVYAALDREFSEPILQAFEKETGIRVKAKFDIESTKTVGLANAILAEQARPRCDLFWNNEILHTLRLKKRGALTPAPVDESKSYPGWLQDRDHNWHGFAGRARVLLVNTVIVPSGSEPKSVEDLADPKWKGKCGLARPLFGTTSTHAALLFAHWGDDRARDFFTKVKSNAKTLAGNRPVAEAVAAGQLAWGLTDTDDAIGQVEKGAKVKIVFPDQDEGQPGVVCIPNTLAVVKGSPHADNAKKLLSFLLRAETEAKLALSESAQIPFHKENHSNSRILAGKTVRYFEADFNAAAEKWDDASKWLASQFVD